MSNQEDPTFETFKDKLNSLQRVMLIYLGVSFFFFFMILIPYYSLKVDGYHLSNMQQLTHSIIGHSNYINQIIKHYTKNIINANTNYTNQIKSNTKSNINANLTVDGYYEKLNTAENKTLTRISDRSCSPYGIRTPPWLLCNLNAFIHNQTSNPQNIPINNTQNISITFKANDRQNIIKALDNITTLQNGFIQEIQYVSVNTTVFTDFQNSLKQFKSSLNQNVRNANLSHLQAVALNLDGYVRSQNLILSNHTNSLLKRFDLLDLPLVGKVPMGFNEMVAVFPLSLAIVYIFFITIVRDTIRLRKTLEENSTDNVVKKYLLDVPLWIDPRRPKCQNGQMLHLIVAWTVLEVPTIIFIASTILIVYS